MEIRKLNAGDYDELLEMLNYAFGNKYGRKMDFVAEQPKMFTQEEMTQAVGKGKARERAKIRKEYEKKYGDLENVLRVGTGQESVEEMTKTFTEFYEGKGIKVLEKPNYTDKDIEVLAKADADDVIGYGYDEVVEEVDRLSKLGLENMTARDKAYFKVLAEYRQKTERQNELSKIGVTAEEYNSKEFQDFAKQFNSTTPIADIFNIYRQTKPKKEIKPSGSMKSTSPADTGVKDYYSYEEAKKFTKADFDKNPALYEAVKKSMTQW
jgi:hypothetical protein